MVFRMMVLEFDVIHLQTNTCSILDEQLKISLLSVWWLFQMKSFNGTRTIGTTSISFNLVLELFAVYHNLAQALSNARIQKPKILMKLINPTDAYSENFRTLPVRNVRHSRPSIPDYIFERDRQRQAYMNCVRCGMAKYIGYSVYVNSIILHSFGCSHYTHSAHMFKNNWLKRLQCTRSELTHKDIQFVQNVGGES